MSTFLFIIKKKKKFLETNSTHVVVKDLSDGGQRGDIVAGFGYFCLLLGS